MLQTTVEYVEKSRMYLETSRLYLERKINHPDSQCHMVLIVVSMALLLDNMLYMVIVPIIPHYMSWLEFSHSSLNKSQALFPLDSSENHGEPNWLIMNVTHNSKEIGFLFACKAIVQLLVNPLSGTVIDRIGYDIPMMIGLIIIFISTTAFAFGTNIKVLFLARGLQGVGSAFADTSGLAMIADRFTEESSRTTALGIALAFISFGSLVAPPFGGILYQYAGKEAPFFILAFIALIDGFLLILIMKPVRLERRELQAEGNLPRGTPIHKLLMDPYIAICAGCLTIANVSLAFLEPTITNWMLDWVPPPSKSQIGLIWLPSFFPHVAGVYTTVKMASKYPQYQWLMAAVGLAMEGISCLFVPVCSNFLTLMLPLCLLCYGIALVDTAILPTLGYLVDTRHVSVYGSIYAIADISYSLAYAIGPVVAGSIVSTINFTGLNIIVFVITCAYVPALYLLRNIYQGHNIKLDTDPDVIQPGRKRSYMMNGTNVDQSKNIENVNNQPDVKVLEKDALLNQSNQPSNRNQQTEIQQYNSVHAREPSINYEQQQQQQRQQQQQQQQQYNSVSQGYNNSNINYSDNIRTNQYGY